MTAVEPITLSQREYVKLQDRLTGRVWVERGPGLVFPQPHVALMGSKATAFSLEAHQYIRLQVREGRGIGVHRGRGGACVLGAACGACAAGEQFRLRGACE